MNRFTKIFAVCLLFASSALPAAAQAVPTVRPGEFACFNGMPVSAINYLPAENKAGRIFKVDKLGNSKFDNTDGHDLREINTEGDYHALVVLVNFRDTKFSNSKDDPRALVDNMLNGENYNYQNATGSANAYFRKISDGQFNPIFDVVGPVTLSRNARSYHDYDQNDMVINPSTGKEQMAFPAGRMVEEAVNLLDGQIEFDKYDANNDGKVDFIYFFFAGKAYPQGGLWPHAFTVTSALGAPIVKDGVEIDRYATSSEIGYTSNKFTGIGTFCHEFSHVLGLPDYYDTANNGQQSKCFTPGSFDALDAGYYNNDEHTPPIYSTYERYALEWMKPVTLEGSANITMLPLEAYSLGYKVNSPSNPQEYFILENRGGGYYDRFLSGSGLLVWHIDFNLGIWQNNKVNNSESHQRIDIIEADNIKSESSRNGDVFPGNAGVHEFTSSVTPSFKDWNSRPVGYELRKINHNFDGTTTFSAIATSGKEMPGMTLDVPNPSIAKATANGFVIEWPVIDGADKYFLSIFNAEKFSGDKLEYDDFANGFWFKRIDNPEVENGLCSIEIEGLEGNERYGIMVYAANDLNASRMQNPIFASTVDPSDFAAASPNLYLSRYEDDLILDWDELYGADDHQVVIANRIKGDVNDSFSLDFSGRLPENWIGTGKTETSAKHSGIEAPSYMLNSSGSYLATPLFDNPIGSISFFSKKRYSDDFGALDIYVADKSGKWDLLTTLTDLYYLDGSKSGFEENKNRTLDLPDGVYGVKLLYRYSMSDLVLHLDDLTINFVAPAQEVSATEAIIEDLTPTSAVVKGLKKNVEYVAYVVARNNTDLESRSNEVRFRLENVAESGIDEIISDSIAATGFSIDNLTIIPADPATAYDIFTIDGMKIAVNVKGNFTLPGRGLYIIRNEQCAVKINL